MRLKSRRRTIFNSLKFSSARDRLHVESGQGYNVTVEWEAVSDELDPLVATTGRSLRVWIAAVEATRLDPLDQAGVRRWLDDTHSVPVDEQWKIAFEVAKKHGWETPSVEEFSDAMFRSNPELRPLHDAVIELACRQGSDAVAQGRSTYIPVVRRTQFLASAPGPRGLLRVGFRFRDLVPPDARIEPAARFAQASHWMLLKLDDRVSSIEQLVRIAYQQNG